MGKDWKDEKDSIKLEARDAAVSKRLLKMVQGVWTFTEIFKKIKRPQQRKHFWDTFMAEETWYPVSWKLQILNSPTIWTSGSEKLSFLQDGWMPCKTLNFILGFLFSNSECENLCYSILVQYFRHTDANYYYNGTCGADLKIMKTITLLISRISVFVVCVQNVAWKGTRRRKIRLFRKPMCWFQLQ